MWKIIYKTPTANNWKALRRSPYGRQLPPVRLFPTLDACKKHVANECKGYIAAGWKFKAKEAA